MGAALVDDRSGVTFDVELCIPWDAPEAVVDINSAEVVTLGSFPDKVRSTPHHGLCVGSC